ncbi:MAG: aspartate aminotransferase family protein [Oscillochloris sp.]|nr:aspartate aminotransferase family protein [Oscillochloris sp.]
MPSWAESQRLLERARHTIPAGVTSNVRAGERPFPLFFAHAAGATLTDVDGNSYIDYVLGQGPMILGHSHPAVLDAVERAMRRGQLFAGQHELEIEVAEALVRLVPCAELCRFGVSGSELVQAAMRLARAVTGRTLILRFEGHYHGWFDNVLLNVATPPDQAGPREQPRLALGSAGQTASVCEDFLLLPWNDLALVEQLFAERGHTIAAIMTEPMMCNTGAIPPAPGFLAGLRRLCDQYGALLYMDEIITGFRLGLSGAQGRFGVTPDLATFAKALAGGFATAALVGRRKYMERFAQDVNHSGTFNGNVISMAAAAAALAELERDDGALYRHMEQLGTTLIDGIRSLAQRHDLPILVQGFPTAFHLSFTELAALHEYRDYALHCDKERYARLKVALLKRGVRVLDRGVWYISAAHTADQIAQTLDIFDAALLEVREL